MDRPMRQALASVIRCKIKSPLWTFPSATSDDLVRAAQDYYSSVVFDYCEDKGSVDTYKYWSYRKGMEKFISPLLKGMGRARRHVYPDQDVELDVKWDNIMSNLDEEHSCPSHTMELLELNELLEEAIDKALDWEEGGIIRDLFGLNESRKSMTVAEVAEYYHLRREVVYRIKYDSLDKLSKYKPLRDIKTLYLGK